MKTFVKVVTASTAERFERNLQTKIDTAPVECVLKDIKFSSHFDAGYELENYSAILIFEYAEADEGKVKNFKMN